MLLNTVFELMNIINNYSNYHGVSEKKSQIDHLYHKSDLGGNAPPQKNLAFLSVGGNFEFLGGNSPPPCSPPPLNTPELCSHCLFQIVGTSSEQAVQYG